MPIVQMEEIDAFQASGHKVSLLYIHSIERDRAPSSKSTMFSTVDQDNYVLRFENPREVQSYSYIRLDVAIKLIQDLDHSGVNPNDSIDVEEVSDYWFDSDSLNLTKKFSNTDIDCKFCGDCGKRTTDLYKEVPDRPEYKNGWIRPIIQIGPSSIDGVHEDCLMYLLDCINKYKNKHSEKFLSETI